MVLFLGVEAPDVPRKMQTEYEPYIAAPLLRETHVWVIANMNHILQMLVWAMNYT